MRLVLRVLLVEFSAAWVMVLAGMVRAGAQAWPFFAESVAGVMGGVAGPWRRLGWPMCLAAGLGIPVVAGWPLLFWPAAAHAQSGYHGWLLAIGIPWWILLVGYGSVYLALRADRAAQRGQGG